MSAHVRFNAILIALVLAAVVTPTAHAQFIGDALAAAGIAASEQQAIEYMQASGRIAPSGPTAATAQRSTSATPPQSITPVDPPKLGTTGSRPAGGSATPAPSAKPSSSGGSTTRPSSGQSYPIGGTTGYAGASLQAASLDPAEVEAWKNAFHPVGTTLPAAPKTAKAITVGGKSYSYDHGVFMEKGAAGFTVVPPPVGAVVPDKPVGAATAFANGKPYIYYYGTFYVYDAASKGYEVVAAPAGARVNYLPESATKEQHAGELHYKYAGTWYKPYYQGSSLVFVVAG